MIAGTRMPLFNAAPVEIGRFVVFDEKAFVGPFDDDFIGLIAVDF